MNETLPVIARTDHQLLVEIHNMLSGEHKEPNRFPSFLEAANNLNEIVEGVRNERWNFEGRRLKDTPEWCKFYTELAKFNRR